MALKRKFPNLPHSVEYLGNGFFRVSSRSHPGEHYDVELRLKADGGPRCPCKGFQIRSWCSHIDSANATAMRLGFTTEDKYAEQQKD